MTDADTFSPRGPSLWPWMAAIALILAIFCTTQPAPADPAPQPNPAVYFSPDLIRIEGNGGGVVDDFLGLVRKWNQDKVRVEIGGDCWSACTLFTAVRTACVLPGAKLHFHAPFMMPASNIRQFDRSYTEWYTQFYPIKVREWVASRGGLGPDWITLEGKALTDRVPSC